MAEPFRVEADGIGIVGEIYRPESVPPWPAVIVCHGIPSGRPAPGDEGYRPLARRLAKEGFLTVIFNFRGCGLSGGNIDLDGWCRDLAAVLEGVFSRPEADRGRIFLFGFSGGAAVSCKVAASDARVGAVALMACPAEFSFLFREENLGEMIARAKAIGSIRDESFPPDPKTWLHGLYGVRAENFIGVISPRPVLILHGTEDDVVPVEHAHRLNGLAGETKTLILVEGAGHRLRQEPQALEAAVAWLVAISKG